MAYFSSRALPALLHELLTLSSDKEFLFILTDKFSSFRVSLAHGTDLNRVHLLARAIWNSADWSTVVQLRICFPWTAWKTELIDTKWFLAGF
jgi:hypothetical protein